MKNKIDKVSIILPYFRKKKFLNKSLNSALTQTYPNKEIIIIFDDHNENELNFVKKIISKYEKYKINK